MATTVVETTDGQHITIEDGVVRSWGAHPNSQKRSLGPGHLAARVRHGAYSDKIIDDHAGQVMEELVGLYPQVAYMPSKSIERYCLAEARLDLLYEAMMERIEQVGVLETMRETPTLMAEISKSEQISLNYAKELGLTVAAWASIAKNMGFARHFGNENLDKLTDEGRKIREARLKGE
jgi:hypothetical protein